MNDKLKGITGFQAEKTVGVSPRMLSLLDGLGEERQAAACVSYALTQPKRCNVVNVQVRPHLQII